MPRPAIPKPGFSLLRLHNSKSPHLIARLPSAAKTNLITSIAQDIEGCIWAVGQYIKVGVLDTTHTSEFDHIINAIHQEERDDLHKRLRKSERKAMVYKRRGRRALRKLEKQRRQERENKDGRREREVTLNLEGFNEPVTTGAETRHPQPVLSGRNDNDAIIPPTQPAQPTQPVQPLQPVQHMQPTQETQTIRETQVTLPANNSDSYPLPSPMDVDAPNGNVWKEV